MVKISPPTRAKVSQATTIRQVNLLEIMAPIIARIHLLPHPTGQVNLQGAKATRQGLVMLLHHLQEVNLVKHTMVVKANQQEVKQIQPTVIRMNK